MILIQAAYHFKYYSDDFSGSRRMVARPKVVFFKGHSRPYRRCVLAFSVQQCPTGQTNSARQALQRKCGTPAARSSGLCIANRIQGMSLQAVEGADSQDCFYKAICSGWWWCGNRRGRSPYGRQRLIQYDCTHLAGRMTQQALGPGPCRRWWAGQRPVPALGACCPPGSLLVLQSSRSWQNSGSEIHRLGAWEISSLFYRTRRRKSILFMSNFCLSFV
jgi:hypothetical protein